MNFIRRHLQQRRDAVRSTQDEVVRAKANVDETRRLIAGLERAIARMAEEPLPVTGYPRRISRDRS